ncbi:lipopolysaccharide assembly protein LapA domain-containing protein [Candidatus Erwinia haradaeae]|uniref:lipopolysaccharide assembly protein LapA domain-containing protein n=1 Tax=Candidatus Erwinia haradaeae TaxID=1922217 RepID=UPI0039F70590
MITLNYLLGQSEFNIIMLFTIAFSIGFLLSWAIFGLLWLRVRISLLHLQCKVIRLQNQLRQVGSSISKSG